MNWYFHPANLHAFLRYCADERNFTRDELLGVLDDAGAWTREYEEFRRWGWFNEDDGVCDFCGGSPMEPNCEVGVPVGDVPAEKIRRHSFHEDGCPWPDCVPCSAPMHVLIGNGRDGAGDARGVRPPEHVIRRSS